MTAPKSQSTRRDASSAKPVVWIVDDSALESEAVRRALCDEFEIEIFADGSSVIERSTQSELPDLLVLDWVMPGVSGVEVCRFLRARSHQLPVLLLTVHRDDEHIAEGLGAGANDFISKPFSVLELTARVRALVATSRMHARAEQAEHERAEAQRLRAEVAEERARMSELYLGIIGHDLVNPLAAIGLAAAALVLRNPDEASRKLAESIHSTSRRAMEMTRALADVTRLRLGRGLEVARERNDLAALCEQLVAELRIAFPDRDIRFAAADGRIELAFDAARMGQVVSNLVSNALIHGRSDTPVQVTLDRGPGEVHLRVTNDGAPIAPERVARLFDPFRRGESCDRGRGDGRGLGLGLYIAQQIVAAHGGSIDVESADVTTFIVRLPA